MGNPALQAIKSYRREGMTSLFKKLLITSKEKLRRIYYNQRYSDDDIQSLSIGDTTATFNAANKAGGDRVRLRHETERAQLKDLLTNLNKDDVFFDIGACVGTHTCFAAERYPEGKVIAFEPYPPNVEQLEKNVSHNKGNITIHDVALSDSTGRIEFKEPNEPAVGYGSSSIAPTSTESTHRIRAVSGDQYIAEEELPRPTVIKIDVEGGEALVVEGMKETLATEECRLLYCEIHLQKEDDLRPSIEDFGSSPDELIAMLHDLGFMTEILDQTKSDIHLKAFKNK